jgi:hypothetical protein
MTRINLKKLWIAQGQYKSITTGQPMVIVMDEKTGGTVLQPLYKGRKEEYTKDKQGNFMKVHPLDQA